MAVDLVTRAEWGARQPKGTYDRIYSTRGVKVHYTGGRVDPRIVDDHSRCIAAVKSIQSMHMDGNGWMDIGYSAAACPHRKVFVGRGPGHLCAANGPGLNSGHYAVLGLVGNAGLVVPPPGMLHGILDAIEWLRKVGGAGGEVKGHKDGYPTSCPGPDLYQWIQRGAPRPKDMVVPVVPLRPIKQDQEEPVPEVVSLGLTAEVEVPASVDWQPWWTEEWRDTAGWHPGGGQSIAPDVDVWADVAAHVALRGLEPGEPVRVGLTRHFADGSPVDIAWPVGKLLTVYADQGGRVEVDLGGQFKLSLLHRGRVTIRHKSTGPVVLETSSAFKAIMHRYSR